jgi:NAD(P)-dependent dehydrogenase (short-subunit alcohol dehydrogenase family)
VIVPHSKQGKVALVTGAAQGLGNAYARRLAAEGAIVVVADVQAAPAVSQDLIACGAPGALFQQTDVADEAQVSDLAEVILARFGRCDIIVNNAGISPRAALEDITLADWRRTMAVNVESAFLICRALVPSMKKHRYGRIINIASDTFGLVIEGFAHYIASKGAVIGLTRALATDLAASGITVNCIAPGLTKTPNTEKMFADGRFFAEFANSQAIKRSAVPADLVGAMSFLASDDAAFFTGQTLVVNGGLLRAI